MAEQSLEAFDLTALRMRLKADRYASISKLIDQVAAHSAIQLDLQRAALCLAQIQMVEEAAGLQEFTSEMGLLTQSLFMNAMFLYTRATHSKPTSRMFVGAEGKYSAAQKQVHRNLTALRDRCLAHYGPGKISAEDAWVDDRVIYRPGDKEEIQYPYIRYDHHSIITAGLADLIATVGPATATSRSNLEKKLVSEIENLISNDEFFASQVRQCNFDELAFHRGDIRAAGGATVTIHMPPKER